MILMVAIFCVGLAAVFVLVVLGVQHGDTYRDRQYPSFRAAAKYVVKKTLHTIKNGIYHEATVYNPKGDTVPDGWDDAVLGRMKQIVE